ncbi:MAG TPA: hypothetical protein ENJ35_01540 [Gammaproteobacteria bacterium]|nr:hypothetical protein [Gammaproteobacteria bacterium]
MGSPVYCLSAVVDSAWLGDGDDQKLFDKRNYLPCERKRLGKTMSVKLAFDQVIDIYEDELNIPNNQYCQQCDSAYKQPLLPWVIGKQYFTKEGGVFFGGKPHRSTPMNSSVRSSGIIDARGRGRELFSESKWPYWSYTKAILERRYGSSELGYEHIAFSNVVKCTSTRGTDKTSLGCATQCIKNNGVIFEEIRLLRPRKIVFYTWSMHRGLFKEIPFSKEGSVVEHTDGRFKKLCGAKRLGWGGTAASKQHGGGKWGF